MDNAGLRALIAVGEHTLITKCITLAGTVVVIWDHLLTLPDEVKYVWRKERSWVFWLFVTSRYSILLYKTWNTISTFWPGYTQELCAQVCNRTVKLEGYYFVFITLGQIFLTMRVYALTEASRYVLVVFGILVTSSFATGVWLVSVPSATAVELPNIHLDSFRTCIFSASTTAEWAYRAQVAVADLVTVVCIVVFVLKLKANHGQSRMTRLMRTILQDGVLYFFVMAAFHLTMVFCTFFTGSYAQDFPPITIIVHVLFRFS
ncbi:hypothetical protein BJ322DRAFT_1104166 [Thelephora terrestris]|uniref:DUF6533 domain-containing protein n=1 Tax=Thelephora terrestris TaxID=56493 RepID=A0A9P6HQ52_9AGAM|nr:hypothetical protein BJ322DRAFT_1104166 [Thelephora terrestris]